MWYTLVHVCQRWRYIALASPRRLNLRLLCPRKRRVGETFGVWPALPIVIWDENFHTDAFNIISALGHRDRVCEIKFKSFSIWHSEGFLPLMQESFPILTTLQIEYCCYYGQGRSSLVLPDSFLGGSAPSLRSLRLDSVLFPALPNLLLSATHLLHLHLSRIPPVFLSPEMAAAFSVLSRLEVMDITFVSPLDFDIEARPPLPLTRLVLPALKSLTLRGYGEYLDDFVARIDVPSINCLDITFRNLRFSVVDLFHLPQFIGRAEIFRSLDLASIELGNGDINVRLAMQTLTSGCGLLSLHLFGPKDRPLSTLVQACNPLMLPLSNVQSLNITTCNPYSRAYSTGATQWVDILRPFSAAKRLSLESMCIAAPVAFVLKQVMEEGMTDVLPVIQELSMLEFLPAGPVREAIEQFVAARGLSAFEPPGRWFSDQDANDG